MGSRHKARGSRHAKGASMDSRSPAESPLDERASSPSKSPSPRHKAPGSRHAKGASMDSRPPAESPLDERASSPSKSPSPRPRAPSTDGRKSAQGGTQLTTPTTVGPESRAP